MNRRYTFVGYQWDKFFTPSCKGGGGQFLGCLKYFSCVINDEHKKTVHHLQPSIPHLKAIVARYDKHLSHTHIHKPSSHSQLSVWTYKASSAGLTIARQRDLKTFGSVLELVAVLSHITAEVWGGSLTSGCSKVDKYTAKLYFVIWATKILKARARFSATYSLVFLNLFNMCGTFHPLCS